MSKVSNSNVIVGSPVSASSINSKFSDVVTATSSIDENNLSYGAVDSVQLKDNYIVVKRGFVDNDSAGSTTPYSALKDGSHGSGVQAVSHVGSTANSTGLLLDFSSSPMVLKDGDLLRVWHSLSLYKHEWGDYINPSAGAGGAYTSGSVHYVTTTFPMWATSSTFTASGTGTGFEPFPGWSTQWTRSTMSGGDPIQVQQPGMSGSSYNSRSYGLALYNLHGVRMSGSELRVRHSGGSTLNYVHQGSDLTIYAIRVFTVGPVHYQRYSSSGVDFLSMTEAATAIGANFRNFYFGRGQIGFMQMRGGSV